MNSEYASAGSQKWLQIAVNKAPEILESALRSAGVLALDESVVWKSPLAEDRFIEYRDRPAFRLLNADPLPNRALAEFWPSRGPVWDALGISSSGTRLLVEAKAHIPEAASPPSQASEKSLAHIRTSLAEARRFYAPNASSDWAGNLYQYANRLAFQYFINQVNGLPSKLVFLDFINAKEMKGPETPLEWAGATRLIHALLGLPADLRKHGVYHVHLDVRDLQSAL